MGVSANALGIQNIPVIAGHDLNSREVGGEKFVAIISDRFVEKLFPGITPQQALGREIKIQLNQGDYTFTVSGVYRYEVTGLCRQHDRGYHHQHLYSDRRRRAD